MNKFHIVYCYNKVADIIDTYQSKDEATLMMSQFFDDWTHQPGDVGLLVTNNGEVLDSKSFNYVLPD